MTSASNTIRVVIPLTIRKRNGRPKILPLDDVSTGDSRAQDPHVLRAVARAWSWRRQLETGTASTIQDIAAAEKSPGSSGACCGSPSCLRMFSNIS
jgi:hypothetical protein